MGAGRPRKPTHLALLHGDQKKNPDRINTAEPVPDDVPVAPPYELTKQVQAVWDRLAPDRIAKGVLTAWDVDAFAAFCEAIVLTQRFARGASQRGKPGAASPLTEFRTAVSVVAQLGSRFGWTPADRAQLVIGGQDERSEDDDLLTG